MRCQWVLMVLCSFIHVSLLQQGIMLEQCDMLKFNLRVRTILLLGNILKYHQSKCGPTANVCVR